jgi:hypothetical protein
MNICSLCTTKAHAKGLCKKHYTKTNHYKDLRRKSDVEYRLRNLDKIEAVRKKRRNSKEFLESEEYAKTRLYTEFGLNYKTLKENEDLVKSKQLSLKIFRTIKKIKNE